MDIESGTSEIVETCVAGHPEDAERFVRLLEPVRAALESFCVRHLRDLGAVADVLQTAVALAYRDFGEYAEGTNFRAWIFRYVSLQIRSRNRDEWSRYGPLATDPMAEDRWEPPAGEPLVDTLLASPERVLQQCDDVLAEAIARLNELERSVLLLRAIGEFQYREIADIVDVPIGTVMSALSRARRRLRERLADYGAERGLLAPPAADRPPEEGDP